MIMSLVILVLLIPLLTWGLMHLIDLIISNEKFEILWGCLELGTFMMGFFVEVNLVVILIKLLVKYFIGE